MALKSDCLCHKSVRRDATSGQAIYHYYHTRFDDALFGLSALSLFVGCMWLVQLALRLFLLYHHVQERYVCISCSLIYACARLVFIHFIIQSCLVQKFVVQLNWKMLCKVMSCIVAFMSNLSFNTISRFRQMSTKMESNKKEGSATKAELVELQHGKFGIFF